MSGQSGEEAYESSDDRQRSVLRELARRKLARKHLLPFVRYSYEPVYDGQRQEWVGYEVNWHHEVVCHYLDLVAGGLMGTIPPERAIKRLMIYAPPGSGKTELVSKRWPAHLLGQNPDLRIIGGTHTADLARDMNRGAQSIMDNPLYRRLFPKTRLEAAGRERGPFGRSVIRKSDDFEIVNRFGRYTTRGIGGSVAGKHCHIGIIDDPVKGREHAESKAFCDKAWGWYTGVFLQRLLNERCPIVIVTTRWSKRDLAGQILANAKERGEEWTIVCLQSILEDPPPKYPFPIEEIDPRRPGEALWPERKGAEALEQIKLINSMDWASLHQQRPRQLEGNLFDSTLFRFYERRGEAYRLGNKWVAHSDLDLYDVVDLAASEKDKSDWTVIGTFGFAPSGEMLMLDRIRKRLAEPKKIKVIQRSQERHGGETWIESTGYQLTTIQNARHAGLPVRKLNPKVSKWVRAITAACDIEAGLVWFPGPATWWEEFEDEILGFTGHGSNEVDDQVDVLSGACEVARRYRKLKAGGVQVKVGGGAGSRRLH